jgi:hypothetical protein
LTTITFGVRVLASHQVLAISGVPVDEPWHRDTVMVPPHGSVTIRQRFADYTGRFVLHCHVLAHGDRGMMQSIEVVTDPSFHPGSSAAAGPPAGHHHH